MKHRTFSPRPDVTIAYHRTGGKSDVPGVIFCGGFMSDMAGSKATFLEAQCKKRGQSYVRFDYTGHGLSSGKFEEGNISSWRADTLDVFDHLTMGPQILIGSSMGGWLALLAAMVRPDRVAGLIGLAAAPDFSEDIYHHEFKEEERRHLSKTGVVYMESAYGPPYPLTQQLFEDGKKHLILHKVIPIKCPVRLIHGKRDPDVPWQKSEQIKKQLMTNHCEVIFVEDGDHRLSRPQDMQLIDDKLKELCGLD